MDSRASTKPPHRQLRGSLTCTTTTPGAPTVPHTKPGRSSPNVVGTRSLAPMLVAGARVNKPWANRGDARPRSTRGTRTDHSRDAACRQPIPSFTLIRCGAPARTQGELRLQLSSDRVSRAAAIEPQGWLRCQTHSACCCCRLRVRRTVHEASRSFPLACVARSQRESRAARGGGGAIRATDTHHTAGLCMREGMRVLMRVLVAWLLDAGGGS
jgi:hypothetical protein